VTRSGPVDSPSTLPSALELREFPRYLQDCECFLLYWEQERQLAPEQRWELAVALPMAREEQFRLDWLEVCFGGALQVLVGFVVLFAAEGHGSYQDWGLMPCFVEVAVVPTAVVILGFPLQD